jgi:hypothetical protein
MSEILTNNYQELVKEIQNLLIAAKENIARQKIEMAWNIGALIEENLGLNRSENYSKQIFQNLASDCEIEITSLYKMHSFFKAYPSLPSASEAITWSHYKVLVAINDEEKRRDLENLIEQEQLPVATLQRRVSKSKKLEKTQNKEEIPTLAFKRGKLFSYKVAVIEGEKFLDLGFNIFKEFSGNFAEGELIESVKNGEKFSFQKSSIEKSQLHTYKARLEKVVDGDTIRVFLDLGFGVVHREILRLAQIDAPDLATKEGQIASKKLSEILQKQKDLIIKTNKVDIFGRYIADVFLGSVDGQYLNQMLLDLRLVAKY